MWLVDLNYSFKSDWLIELSDNNLASELVENRSLLKQSQSRKYDTILGIVNPFSPIFNAISSKKQLPHFNALHFRTTEIFLPVESC